MADRYEKQELFGGLGREGQARLGASSVLIAGAGALGGHLAQLLVRTGVGRVRLVDRDYPELSNLHRQPLYDEEDLASGLAKATIAEKKLRRINSQVRVEGVVAELGPGNVLDLAGDVDLILDGLDNAPARFLINDAAVHLNKPWIYTGVAAAGGNVLTIIPGRTPCLRCLYPEPPPPEAVLGVNTVGIIGPTPALAAAYAAAEAIKLLTGTGQPPPAEMLAFDLWRCDFEMVPLSSGPIKDCLCCGQHRFTWLRPDCG